GTDSLYSNVGYEVLYAAIGEAAGQPFGRYVMETFFEPSGASSAGWHFEEPGRLPPRYAYGHQLKGAEIIPVLGWDEDDQGTQGALYATANDLALVLQTLARKHYAEKLKDADGLIAHAGGSRGKRAYGEIDPDEGDAVVFLSNFDGIPFARLVTDLRALVKEEPYELPKEVNRQAITLSESALRRWTGRYRFAEIEGLELVIKLGDGVLELYQNGKLGGVMQPESESVFFENPASSESVAFEETEEGKVMLLDWQGVTWRGERIGPAD
ncbi:MAG: serine hydrolase domain-containing protein, partial [Parvularcula sp.]|nr:serine hydrolase domain-containing protein [Parvularcula sp.]